MDHATRLARVSQADCPGASRTAGRLVIQWWRPQRLRFAAQVVSQLGQICCAEPATARHAVQPARWVSRPAAPVPRTLRLFRSARRGLRSPACLLAAIAAGHQRPQAADRRTTQPAAPPGSRAGCRGCGWDQPRGEAGQALGPGAIRAALSQVESQSQGLGWEGQHGHEQAKAARLVHCRWRWQWRGGGWAMYVCN